MRNSHNRPSNATPIQRFLVAPPSLKLQTKPDDGLQRTIGSGELVCGGFGSHDLHGQPGDQDGRRVWVGRERLRDQDQTTCHAA